LPCLTGRTQFAPFTLRRENTLIRVISARAYGERADSGEHLDWSRAKPARLPNLQPSKTAISLRLPVSLLDEIKIAANKRDAPYQSLIKWGSARRFDKAAFAPAYRENFLYFSRCGMMLSMPRRRFLSSS
jgi:CopG antitoxin of type II toxin-antitoxin system